LNFVAGAGISVDQIRSFDSNIQLHYRHTRGFFIRGYR